MHFRQKWNQLSVQNRDNPEKTGAVHAGGAPPGRPATAPCCGRRRRGKNMPRPRPQRQFLYLSML
jgi:hypothetical protein